MPNSAPRIYDVLKDSERPITQDEVDRLDLIVRCYQIFEATMRNTGKSYSPRSLGRLRWIHRALQTLEQEVLELEEDA